jgi:hypothetical protein
MRAGYSCALRRAVELKWIKVKVPEYRVEEQGWDRKNNS